MVKVHDDHNLRAGYNHALKSPTILENNLLIQDVFRGNKTGYVIRDAAGTVVDTIDPLAPERVNGFEVGYKGIVDDRLFVDAVVYTSFYRDFISPLTASANPATGTFAYLPDGTLVAEGTPMAGALFTYRNFGAAQVRGADIGASWKPIDEVDLSSSPLGDRAGRFHAIESQRPAALAQRAGAQAQGLGDDLQSWSPELLHHRLWSVPVGARVRVRLLE